MTQLKDLGYGNAADEESLTSTPTLGNNCNITLLQGAFSQDEKSSDKAMFVTSAPRSQKKRKKNTDSSQVFKDGPDEGKAFFQECKGSKETA